MEKIAAGIVLFNPNLEKLKDNVNSIYNQVDKLIIVDNNSLNALDVQLLFGDYLKVEFIFNESNFGIAKALNQIMFECIKVNIKWVLTLDQDTLVPHNLISEYVKYINTDKLGIITPLIVDINRKKNEEMLVRSMYVDQCITSASLTSVNAWKSVGMFDEKLFIDLVDFEFCKRLIKSNFKILKLKDVQIKHEIGKISQKKLFSKEINVMNHSAFRKYYMARNLIYVAKKHPFRYSVLISYFRILKIVLVVILYEKKKYSKIKMIIQGIFDSYKM